jgi:uncharacterized MAPEG superfamily protein
MTRAAEKSTILRRRHCRNWLPSFVSIYWRAGRRFSWPVGLIGATQAQSNRRDENAMTTDLFYLALTAMLTAALWIPYIASQVMTNGPLSGENYADPAPRPVPLWGQRANRAHINAVESFAPFAALVIVAQLAGKANGMTAFWAASFFWLRLAHAVVYWTAIPYLRTVLFTLGFVCVVGLFWQVIM